jgi:hypothetical protein
MTAKRDICAVCAWRATCNKKYSVSGKGIRCAEFVRDVTLGPEEEEEKESTPIKRSPEKKEENY